MFIPKGYKRVLICIRGKSSVPKSCWVCFDPLILPEHLPPSWQSAEGRPETFKLPKSQEVGSWNRRKKRGWPLSPLQKVQIFSPQKFVKHVFWMFDLSSAWGHIHIQRSHRLFRWLLERGPETSKNPPNDVMCETIMVMFQYLQEVVATSCDTQFVRIWCHDMLCVATTWVAWNTWTFPNIIGSLSCPGSTGRLKPCLRKKNTQVKGRFTSWKLT